ncbi:PREDICTED: olfactory receptor 12-like [Condylura cristata]|uniref:olfactory receptor 12-like n=1 Tax=Condylura cristata TaxID=143302 RepID=UPI00064305CE|nr:PREDICTED: olfactory receptor 12-like [Condylura cristata]
MGPPARGNQSGASLQDFVLLGFAGGVHTQALLFALFLGLYVATVLGNLTMIVVITLDARLHSPMYFFLKNLSFVDLCYSSVIAPNALANFFSPSKTITFMGCATQFFFLSLFATTEAFLLAVMAYDRFMAICRPLRYPVTMCPSACARLVLGTYCGGCINTLVQTSFTFTLPFCGSRRVDHFFCDVPPLLPLACADTTLNQLVMFGVCGLIIVGTSLVVLVSYGYIAGTILRVHSGAARHKVFSTCSSHMTAVCLFYGTLFVMYAQPGAVASMEQGKVVSVFYTLVIPMLNPLSDSLRNKGVKEALSLARCLAGNPGTWWRRPSCTGFCCAERLPRFGLTCLVSGNGVVLPGPSLQQAARGLAPHTGAPTRAGPAAVSGGGAAAAGGVRTGPTSLELQHPQRTTKGAQRADGRRGPRGGGARDVRAHGRGETHAEAGGNGPSCRRLGAQREERKSGGCAVLGAIGGSAHRDAARRVTLRGAAPSGPAGARRRGVEGRGKVVSVFYTLVIPMLNPLSDSLRNKGVKEAVGRHSAGGGLRDKQLVGPETARAEQPRGLKGPVPLQPGAGQDDWAWE